MENLNVKVGDKLIYDGSIVTVQKVTPTGRIKVQWGFTEKEFEADGRPRGERWRNGRLAIPAADDLLRIEKRQLVLKLRELEPGKLTLEQLRKIDAIIYDAAAEIDERDAVIGRLRVELEKSKQEAERWYQEWKDATGQGD